MTTNKDANMERPLVWWIGHFGSPAESYFSLAMRVAGLHYGLIPSKVYKNPDPPKSFRVLDVYRFPMHEDMRLTVVPDGGVLPVELQFKCNEAFIAAVMPKKVDPPTPEMRGVACRVVDRLSINGHRTLTIQHPDGGLRFRTVRNAGGLTPDVAHIYATASTNGDGRMAVVWRAMGCDSAGTFYCDHDDVVLGWLGEPATQTDVKPEPPKPVWKYKVAFDKLLRGHPVGDKVMTEHANHQWMDYGDPKFWHDTPDAAITHYENHRSTELANAMHDLVVSAKLLRKQAEAFQ